MSGEASMTEYRLGSSTSPGSPRKGSGPPNPVKFCGSAQRPPVHRVCDADELSPKLYTSSYADCLPSPVPPDPPEPLGWLPPRGRNTWPSPRFSTIVAVLRIGLNPHGRCQAREPACPLYLGDRKRQEKDDRRARIILARAQAVLMRRCGAEGRARGDLA